MMAEGEPMPHRALWCRDSSGHQQGESGALGSGNRCPLCAQYGHSGGLALRLRSGLSPVGLVWRERVDSGPSGLMRGGRVASGPGAFAKVRDVATGGARKSLVNIRTLGFPGKPRFALTSARPSRKGASGMATTEPAMNDVVAAVLRQLRRTWASPEVVRSENTGMLRSSAKRPDILVMEPGTSPVVVETEVLPAR